MTDRINYSEDEEYPGQFELWQANCWRSIKGRAGQASLRELETALLAMPSKRLISNSFDNEAGDVCAIGALARHKGITPEADPEFEMEEVGVECGMPPLVAWKVVEVTDHDFDSRWERPTSEYPHGRRVDLTPEERYTAVLAWVQKQLREVADERRG